MQDSLTHYELRESPLLNVEYDDVWWGIARAIKMCDDSQTGRLARSALTAAWEAIEYVRESHAEV